MKENSMTVQNESFWDFKGTVDYVDRWPLMGSPWIALIILVSYLFFVLKCGYKFMENRPPYKLRRTLIVYNVFQVAFSCYIFYIGTEVMLEIGLTESTCMLENERWKYTIARGIYIYFIAKLSELIDTIFFVLRKKWNQVSFLHVYHHSIMYVCAWLGAKYEITYSVVFLGTINSFVHVIMYSYYALSAFPRLTKYLWWKKYITKLQLIQFLLILIQVTYMFVKSPCPPSYIILYTVWVHVFLFTYLFTDFYVKSYLQNRKDVSGAVSSDGGGGKKILDKSK